MQNICTPSISNRRLNLRSPRSYVISHWYLENHNIAIAFLITHSYNTAASGTATATLSSVLTNCAINISVFQIYAYSAHRAVWNQVSWNWSFLISSDSHTRAAPPTLSTLIATAALCTRDSASVGFSAHALCDSWLSISASASLLR